LKLPEVLPSTNPIKVTSTGPVRYYENVCTLSYSFAFWNWERWQRELDWMALNWINVPLAFVGQESVWRQVWLNEGLTDKEIGDFFGGPAFLAWARMGNLKGYGGPLPLSWHNNQLILQKQILKRMDEFGMTPVLPGFAGFVPDAFSRIHPNVSVSRSHWLMEAKYDGVLQIHPVDPMFVTIGGKYIQQMKKMFNHSSHLYNVDTFNEMTPGSTDLNYLKSSAQAVLKGLSEFDKDAVWVMQGWLFLEGYWTVERAKAYITAVPKDRQIILDLNSPQSPQFPRFNSYFGHPFVYCMIENFGGQNSLWGYLPHLNKDVVAAFNNNDTAFSLIGTGITPEGINENEIQFELMAEFAWRKEEVDLIKWTEDFYRRRYGIREGIDAVNGLSLKENVYLYKGWMTLLNSVYNCPPDFNHHLKDYLYRPSLKYRYKPCYDRYLVGSAWISFGAAISASASGFLKSQPLFLYDLVDVSREALAAGASTLIFKIRDTFNAKNHTALAEQGSLLLDLFKDLDLLLASDSHFLFGSNIKDARSWGTTEEEKDLMEKNIRLQVTVWDDRVSGLNDYAAKQWQGLMADYYQPRWAYFITKLFESLVEGKNFDEGKYETELFNLVELPFSESKKKYPDKPVGDSVKVVLHLLKKWHDILYP